MKYLFILSFFMFTACTSTEPEQASEVNVPQDAFDIRPLLIGESLPDVSLTGIDGNQTSIAGLVADKPSMIVFYRKVSSLFPFINIQSRKKIGPGEPVADV